MIPSTTISVSTSASMVIIPWEKTVLIVSRSLMVRVVELPMGVRSKYDSLKDVIWRNTHTRKSRTTTWPSQFVWYINTY